MPYNSKYEKRYIFLTNMILIVLGFFFIINQYFFNIKSTCNSILKKHTTSRNVRKGNLKRMKKSWKKQTPKYK